MPITQDHVAFTASPNTNILTLRLSGTLNKDDYEQFIPAIENAITAHGKIRLLIELADFKGWTLPAMWEDLKFDVKHYADVERIAILGHTQWARAMATLSKPFTAATVRYFDTSEISEAEQWINERDDNTRP